jgi:hypothetical protein
MSENLDQMGPVDYLVIEFPDSRMTGEGLPLLVNLVDRGIIRVLDLRFVKKLANGSVTGLTIGEIDNADGRGLGVFAGASSGLIADDELEEMAGVLAAGSSAVVIVYENTWAAPLASALRRAGGQLVASARIPVQALLAALEATEAQTAATGAPGR